MGLNVAPLTVAGVVAATYDGYALCNPTCELGMTRAIRQPNQHILELLNR